MRRLRDIDLEELSHSAYVGSPSPTLPLGRGLWHGLASDILRDVAIIDDPSHISILDPNPLSRFQSCPLPFRLAENSTEVPLAPLFASNLLDNSITVSIRSFNLMPPPRRSRTSGMRGWISAQNLGNRRLRQQHLAPGPHRPRLDLVLDLVAGYRKGNAAEDGGVEAEFHALYAACVPSRESKVF